MVWDHSILAGELCNYPANTCIAKEILLMLHPAAFSLGSYNWLQGVHMFIISGRKIELGLLKGNNYFIGVIYRGSACLIDPSIDWLHSVCQEIDRLVHQCVLRMIYKHIFFQRIHESIMRVIEVTENGI